MFDDNVYIGNSALELLNNLILNEAVYARVLSADGFKHQLKQLFSVADGWLNEGLKEYTDKKVPADKKVDFSSQLVKFKTLLSILCIIDDVHEEMLKHVKTIKLSSVASLFARVKDPDFIADIVMKLKFLADNLIKKKDVVQLDTTASEYIRELDKHFSQHEIKMLIAILG